jgi:hypothetical protein
MRTEHHAHHWRRPFESEAELVRDASACRDQASSLVEPARNFKIFCWWRLSRAVNLKRLIKAPKIFWGTPALHCISPAWLSPTARIWKTLCCMI